MKTIIIITGMLLSLMSFGQSEMKLYGDIQGGAGVTVSGKAMFHGTAGFNAILSNNLYLRLGADLAFGGSNKVASQLASYNNYSLRVGFANTVSDKLIITPYVGFGYVTGSETTSRLDTDAMAADLAASLASSALNGETPTVENRYLKQDFTSLALPVGVDFNIHGEKIGFTTGFYYLVSQHSEIGLRIGITFGKF